MKGLKKQMKNKLLYGIPFVIMLTAFYTFLSFAISANSDNMSSLLSAKDIAEGNLRLNGWSLSTQSYLFQISFGPQLSLSFLGIAHQ